MSTPCEVGVYRARADLVDQYWIGLTGSRATVKGRGAVARVVRGGVGPIAWRMPGLTWVHDGGVGDVMVGGVDPRGMTPAAQSVSDSRPRTVITSTLGAGRKGGLAISSWLGGAAAIGLVGIAQSLTGWSAAGPSARRVWKQRRVSLRAIVSEAWVCERPRALSAR